MKSFDALTKKVAELQADATKTAAGNKSAGIRLRKGMQEIKKMAQDVRDEVMVVTG